MVVEAVEVSGCDTVIELVASIVLLSEFVMPGTRSGGRFFYEHAAAVWTLDYGGKGGDGVSWMEKCRCHCNIIAGVILGRPLI